MKFKNLSPEKFDRPGALAPVGDLFFLKRSKIEPKRLYFFVCKSSKLEAPEYDQITWVD
jgi:hypothetical protein